MNPSARTQIFTTKALRHEEIRENFFVPSCLAEGVQSISGKYWV